MDNDIKSAVIIFHKNVDKYPSEWIKKCISSIKNQSYKKFKVFEIDYGGTNKQIYDGSDYESIQLKDHAIAHNYLLDKVFDLGYDCAFNTNIDDMYAINRIEKQLQYIKSGYDVISSNFHMINENNSIIGKTNRFEQRSIELEARRNHNILAHPVICYSRNFWSTCTKLRNEEIPKDDFELWKRSFGKYKFIILREYLLFYRIHKHKVSNANTLG